MLQVILYPDMKLLLVSEAVQSLGKIPVVGKNSLAEIVGAEVAEVLECKVMEVDLGMVDTSVLVVLVVDAIAADADADALGILCLINFFLFNSGGKSNFSLTSSNYALNLLIPQLHLPSPMQPPKLL